MCNRDNLESNINHIYDNLELLEAGNIYELRKTPGKPKCATLAKQIREDVEAIAEGLEECIEDADEEQFELLAKLLGALYSEFSALSKKQPDALTNTFKTKQINRVLVPLKQIMNSEDSVLQWYRNLRHFKRHFLMNLIYCKHYRKKDFYYVSNKKKFLCQIQIRISD